MCYVYVYCSIHFKILCRNLDKIFTRNLRFTIHLSKVGKIGGGGGHADWSINAL
jgi:hypothetical protein